MADGSYGASTLEHEGRDVVGAAGVVRRVDQVLADRFE